MAAAPSQPTHVPPTRRIMPLFVRRCTKSMWLRHIDGKTISARLRPSPPAANLTRITIAAYATRPLEHGERERLPRMYVAIRNTHACAIARARGHNRNGGHTNEDRMWSRFSARACTTRCCTQGDQRLRVWELSMLRTTTRTCMRQDCAQRQPSRLNTQPINAR